MPRSSQHSIITEWSTTPSLQGFSTTPIYYLFRVCHHTPTFVLTKLQMQLTGVAYYFLENILHQFFFFEFDSIIQAKPRHQPKKRQVTLSLDYGITRKQHRFSSSAFGSGSSDQWNWNLTHFNYIIIVIIYKMIRAIWDENDKRNLMWEYVHPTQRSKLKHK